MICFHNSTTEKDDVTKDTLRTKRRSPVEVSKPCLAILVTVRRNKVTFFTKKLAHNGLRLIDCAEAQNMIVCSSKFE